MMVTKKQLLEDNEKREQEKDRQEEHETWEKEKLEKDSKYAKEAVKGEFGKWIRKLNSEGIVKIKIGKYSRSHKKDNNHKDGSEIWNDLYGSPEGSAFQYHFPFTLEPEYKPTKILQKSLRIAGFEVELKTEMVQNYKSVTTADGYDIVDVPGEHPEYYMIISWDD